MNDYPIGAVVRVSSAFTVAGVATDPTTCTLKVRTPSAAITTYVYGVDSGLIRDSAGAFHFDIVTNLSGIWSYRFISTGTAAAANETEFFIKYSDFGATG